MALCFLRCNLNAISNIEILDEACALIIIETMMTEYLLMTRVHVNYGLNYY